MKNLGICVGTDPRWHSYCVEISRRAAQLAKSILGIFQCSRVEIYRKAVVAHCRPMLEYHA